MDINGSFKTKRNQFAQVSNIALHDDKLSMRAKGLYSIIQSYITIPNFILYKNMLMNKSTEGKRAFESAWKELITNGYLIQEKHNSNKGFYYLYDLLDEPKTPQVHFADMGNPGMGNVVCNNNTNSNNTNINNTEYKDKGIQRKVSFYSFLKDKNNLIDIDKESIEAVKYYLEVYSNYFSGELKYTLAEWKDILDFILYSELHDNLSGLLDVVKEAIDKHFETKYEYKEMYLLHNFRGITKDNRLYESNIL